MLTFLSIKCLRFSGYQKCTVDLNALLKNNKLQDNRSSSIYYAMNHGSHTWGLPPDTPCWGSTRCLGPSSAGPADSDCSFPGWLRPQTFTCFHLPSCLSYNTLHTWTSSFRWYGLLKNSSFYFLAFWSNLARARIRWAKLLFVISLMAAPSSHLHSLTHQQISGARCPPCAKPLGFSSRPHPSLSPSVLWTPTSPRKLLLPSASSSSQLAPHFKAPSRRPISPQTTVQLYTSVDSVLGRHIKHPEKPQRSWAHSFLCITNIAI